MAKAFRRALIALAAGVALCAVPAFAKNVQADGRQIAALLKTKARDAEVKTDDAGVYVRVSGHGYGYSIFPYGCDDKGENCKSIQFFAAFNPKTSPTLDAMNSYARENRWGRVYLDKDNDPAIEFDVDLEQGGMSEALFVDNVEYWETVLAAFGDFVFGPNGENNNPASGS